MSLNDLPYFPPAMRFRSMIFIWQLCASGWAVGQSDLERLRRLMIHGEADSVIARLERNLARTDADPLDRTRALELLGEQYHRLSDIGEAKRYWDEALILRQRAFGDSSAEAAVGYAYRARYHNYMAASQTDHQYTALVDGARAKQLLNTRSGRIELLERL